MPAPARLAVGVDLGTSSAKAVVLDPDRGVLGTAGVGYPTSYPRDGWAEHDPDDWWQAVCGAVHQALDSAGVGAADIDALGFSGMGGATAFLDDCGRPVAPALINLDRRATAEHEQLRSGPFATAVAEASGNSVGAWNVGVKTRWLARHRPELFEQTRLITSPGGYLLRRATGRAVQSVSDAGIFDLFDLPARDWSAPVCEVLGISSQILPEVVGSLERVGQLTAAAAADLGLDVTCVVVAGAEDTPAAALAAGVTTSERGYVSMGTAGVVGVVTEVNTARQPRVLRFPHVFSGLDLLSGSMSTAGAAIQWLASVTGQPVASLLELAGSASPGSGGVTFLPYLAGELHPINDPHARAIFAGLSIDTTTEQLARAVLEGSANAIAHNLEVIAEVTAPPAALRATGRPTESGVWCQSIADAAGIPVEAAASTGAPTGAAILALAPSEAEARELANRHVRVRAHYQPDPKRVDQARDRRAFTQALYTVAASHR